jgi:hypothetical protein
LKQVLRQLRSRGSKWALVAFAITASVACVAAIAAVSYVTATYVNRGSDGSAGEVDTTPGPRVEFPAGDYRQRGLPRPDRGPQVGMNYTHYAFPNCDPSGTGILATLHEPGVAEKVHAQLLAMRRRGITTLRTIVWNITDASEQDTGTVSSAGGRVHEPYRTNLIRYLVEVRRFGFRRLTLAFSPQGRNNPVLPGYDPARFEENWRFIREVRALLKRHGPADTRIDLQNEGAPSDYMPAALKDQLERYLGDMYGRYAAEFGTRDVTVSLVAPRRAADLGNRLQNLIDIVRETGMPQPRWYDVHIGYTGPRAAQGLRNSDRVLTRNRRSQPLVVGETAYDDPSVAAAIERFLERRSRRIEEVSPWYIREERGCRISPPYEVRAYRKALEGGT